MKFSRSRCLSGLFTLAVTLALFVGGAALNYLGLNYSGDESASGMKIHPYVIVTLISLLMLSVSIEQSHSKISDRRFRVPAICSIVVIGILIFRSMGSGRQSLGFAVDTLVSALWAAAIVPFLKEKTARRVWTLGFVFVFVECTMAIIEVVTGTEFIPIDTWYGGYFRATALHGHPLNNALVLVTVAVSLQLSATRRTSVAIFLLTIGALSAFGARGALAVYLLTNAIWFARFGLKSAGRMSIVLLGIPVVLTILGWVLLSGALGDRIANVGAYDDSSGVRLQSIQMLQGLNWGNLIAGTDPDQVLRIMENANVSVIENFLVAYIFMFGLACTLLLFLCFWVSAKGLSRLWGHGSAGTVWAIFTIFAATALTNNSLVTKTPALYLCVVFAWAAAYIREAHKCPASEMKSPVESRYVGGWQR
ncbi:VpsF family polysaccharide biosynthesis protein [Paraburkholderia sp. J10-1]|uniref:VpsF family polysaccharide biosynthesis protein n=1 Tax=Paraburkholderia sp. J10-1 TaxID=2805430 RepID=UPI002AB63BA0|nr:VpsF family polysaccharide biosynthesis protein [Paraburkholderia sp. J10-1]